MRTIVTQFSTYEVNEDDKLIRRIEGQHAPTPRQGDDGTWRSYFALTDYADGVLIVWDEDGHSTLTSPVVRVL